MQMNILIGNPTKIINGQGNHMVTGAVGLSEEIVVSGEDALKVADALNSTSLRVLQLLSKEHLDVSTIAQRLRLSQPYVSEQVRKLQEANLIKVSYESGKRGIRKICELAVKKIIIKIQPF
jgi:predicted transcriptional regulator